MTYKPPVDTDMARWRVNGARANDIQGMDSISQPPLMTVYRRLTPRPGKLIIALYKPKHPQAGPQRRYFNLVLVDIGRLCMSGWGFNAQTANLPRLSHVSRPSIGLQSWCEMIPRIAMVRH